MKSSTFEPGLTVTTIGRGHTGHNKPLNARKTEVETLEKLDKIQTEDTEVKNTDANVGNGQMSFMSEANTIDHNRTQRPHTV